MGVGCCDVCVYVCVYIYVCVCVYIYIFLLKLLLSTFPLRTLFFFFFKGNILRIENRPEQMIWKETVRKLIYRLNVYFECEVFKKERK